MLKRTIVTTLMILLVTLAMAPMAAFASSYSGAHGFGNVSVEPAYDGRTGQEVFILLPNDAHSQEANAWSPLYLVMYPTSTSISMLDCTPDNCDHAQAIPGTVLSSVADGTPYDTVTTSGGTVGVVAGHDHLLGVDDTGKMHRTYHVYFALFTTKDGCVPTVGAAPWDTEVTTLSQLDSMLGSGCMVTRDTGLIVHAAIVSGATYMHSR